MKMIRNEDTRFPVAKAGMQSQDDSCMRNLAQDGGLLYDLVDLEKIFKVSKRTLFNWRSVNKLPLIEFGGKLYLSHKRLMSLIEEKEGAWL